MKRIAFAIIVILLVGCATTKSNKMIDNRFYQSSPDENGDVLQISIGHDNNFHVMRGMKAEVEGIYEKINDYKNVYIFKYENQSQVVVIDEENGFYFAYPDTSDVYRLDFISTGYVAPTH